MEQYCDNCKQVHEILTMGCPNGPASIVTGTDSGIGALQARISALEAKLAEESAKYTASVEANRALLADVDAVEANNAEWEKRFTAPIVCMCGSTKFRQSWIAENARLTDEGNIVLAVGLWGHHNGGGFVWGPELTDERKAFLDDLHKRKIDLCDWVWVLDIGGYIGSSTRSEIEYAESLKKPVRYLSQEFPQYHEPADPLAEAMEVVRGVVRMENDNKLRNWYGQWYCACCGNLVECHAPDCLVTKAREIVRKVDGK